MNILVIDDSNEIIEGIDIGEIKTLLGYNPDKVD